MDYKDILLTISVILNVFVLIFLENIKKRHLLDIEKLKNDLQKSLIDYQVKFSKLHDERLEVIKTFYQRLILFEVQIVEITNKYEIAETREEKWDYYRKFSIKYNTLKEYFDVNKIFFNSKQCDLIDNLFYQYDEYMRIYRNAKNIDYKKENFDTMIYFMELYEKEFAKSYEIYKKVIPKVKSEIEDQFREMLGVN